MNKHFNQENIDYVQHLCDTENKIENTLDWLRLYGVDFKVKRDEVLGSEYHIEYVYCRCPMSCDIFLVRVRCVGNFSKLSELASAYKTPIEQLEHIVKICEI